jgi:poly [ADP-ribose] polymerase
MGRKPVHLVFVEEKDKGDGVDHNKFYDMFERNGECHCLWGRRQDDYEFGKSGKLTIKPLYEWDKILSSKIGKGYEDKSYLYEDLLTTQVVGKASDADLYAPIDNPKIAEIVDRLQRYANEVIKANYSVKSGQVTQIMVDEVQKCLNYMTTAGTIDEFNSYLLEIFKIIPRSMSRVDAFLANSQNDVKTIISREQDLLDIMRGQIITPVRGQKVKTVKGDKKTILELNGITFEEATAEDIELVKNKLGSNASRLKNVWKVANEKQTKAYISYCESEGIRKRDCKLLFHGTRSENVWSILKTGLVLRPTNAVITGKMFGYGLYFAPSSQKSLGYTSLSGSYWARGSQNTGFMILHAVAYGKPYDVHSFDSKYYNFDYAALRRACPGAHCLHAHAGSMLRNDEIIVYKEEQVMPLYLIEIG